ncbi:hypothetical protein Ccar_12240 [Clostridium carboxidivorans P7]|uniref:Integral membrane protein n=1 Tax=Clostridium carboxidivorans P7 TaxID=536227 RepID=C6PY68_9CLOT|nr:DUF2512 family protein [Clostridium carboxidivorans]AKN31591.1 hypothetical protein Ccar_12240 [Clostridium carboxidivorans P7]EET85800.1 conserved hypothetical protein [Clostridium carboxidivorans P7]EFG86998.1 hypothetical protein CLCAR_3098 [Clostridium carboxidivorans P7]
MRHVVALLIKFVMVAVVLEIIFSILTTLTFSSILYIAAAVTIIAYIIGDLLILPASNNTIASMADVALALATMYMFNYIWSTTQIHFVSALIAAVIISTGEWFFHKYVSNIIFRKRKD